MENNLTYEHYKRIWQNFILKYCNEIINKNNVTWRKLNSKDTVLNIENRIWDDYCVFRRSIKDEFKSPEHIIMDRHKICSALMCSILKNSPIVEINTYKQIGTSKIANEYIALNVGLEIMKTFCEFELQSNKNFVLYDKIKLLDVYIFPECKENEFGMHILKLLKHIRNKNIFEPFSIAFILFFIEKYTILQLNNS